MKRLAWYTAVSLATIAGLFLLWEFRSAILLFILSLMVAATIRPIVDYLVTRRVPKGLSLLITYLAVVGFFAAVGMLLFGPVLKDLQAIARDLPGNYQQMQNNWLGGSWFQQAISRSFPNLNDLSQTITGGQWNIFAQNFLGITLGSLDMLSKILIVFVLSIYWSADQDHFKRLWLSLLPSESRARWREVWQNIEHELGAYLRSELIQSLLTVILLGIGYQLIGLNYPVLLAFFGAVSWLIVWFGGLAAVILALLAGLAINPGIGLLAAFFTLSVLIIMEFLVEPRLFNRQRLSSLLVVIVVLILVKQYGIIGFLAAPPLATAIQIFASQLIRPATAITTVTLAPPPTIQIDLLRERLNSVQNMITVRSEPPAPEIINLVDRLDQLIDRANQEEQLTD